MGCQGLPGSHQILRRPQPRDRRQAFLDLPQSVEVVAAKAHQSCLQLDEQGLGLGYVEEGLEAGQVAEAAPGICLELEVVQLVLESAYGKLRAVRRTGPCSAPRGRLPGACYPDSWPSSSLFGHASLLSYSLSTSSSFAESTCCATLEQCAALRIHGEPSSDFET